MLTTMRRIGNSKGVLIPAAFLASCNIQDQVDMQLKDGHIIISPVASKLRVGWFDDAQSAPTLNEAAQKTAQQTAQDQALQDWADPTLADDSEWVW